MSAGHVFEFSAGADAPDDLVVVSFRGVERLSRPSSFELLLSTSSASAPDLLGRRAALAMRTEGAPPRVVHGLVAMVRAEPPRQASELAFCRVKLVSRIWALGVGKNTRIFQDLSVPQIVDAILEESGLERRFRLARAYPPRSYCVQHRESDLAFITRLLAEEGIYYAVEDTDDPPADVIVLADAAHYEPIAGEDRLTFRESAGLAGGSEHVGDFVLRARVRPGAAQIAGFDFRRPARSIHASAEVTAPEGAAARPGYEPDRRYSAWSVSDAAAQISLEQDRADARVAVGHSSSRRLVPGRAFDLVEHPSAEANRRWAVTRVEHEGRHPEAHGAGSAAGEPFVYRNDLRCVPADVAARPRRPRRRILQALETATVVGPAGEEIHTDEHGRVKVQFHWDREGRHDDHSSCWIRAMQPWAGPMWGAQFIPRVGMEVVVGFLAGDPDRPLILGTAYNGTHPTPFALPANKTRSGLRTQSTPGGGGYNELRFEDAAGKEQVYLRAQRDLDERVGHDHTRVVGGDEHVRVQQDRVLEVEQDHVRTVHGNEIVTVHKNLIVHVVGKQHIIVDGTSPDNDPAARGGGGAAPKAPAGEPKAPPSPRPPDPQAKTALARLSWLVEKLPEELYGEGDRLRATAQAIAGLAEGLGHESTALQALPGGAAELTRRADALEFEVSSAEQMIDQQLADKEPGPPALGAVEQAFRDSLERTRDNLRRLRGELGQGGILRGGGGADPVFHENQDVKFDYKKQDGQEVHTDKGSKMEIVGGGEISSPDGFRISAGDGCFIELTPGGIKIKGPVVTVEGTPIKLNC